MKILVAVKRVVDYAVKVRVRPDRTAVDTGSVKMSMNPFCEIAVEEALRLREAGAASEVVAATVGPAQAADTLRTALAMGAARAVHVLHDPDPARPLLPLAVPQILRALALQESPGLLILGKQAIDDDCNQTGQMLAALLNWPQGTFASKVPSMLPEEEIHSHITWDAVQQHKEPFMPTDLRLNQPRYATLPNIMKAKSKVIKKVTPADLDVDVRSDMEVLRVDEPPKRKAGVILSSVDELLDKLKNEARVL
uniref:Electron transfer flavoprotein subunit beta n=1 Tax=Aegilops tauschii TaxID=37682 RepID=M8BDB5_AEGTA